MDAFKARAPAAISDCGERSVSVEPIWHKDWAGIWLADSEDNLFLLERIRRSALLC
jgi:hypothetical protein